MKTEQEKVIRGIEIFEFQKTNREENTKTREFPQSIPRIESHNPKSSMRDQENISSTVVIDDASQLEMLEESSERKKDVYDFHSPQNSPSKYINKNTFPIINVIS